MTCGIYCITNTKNKKRYIGSAVNIEKRWISHRTRLNRKQHHSGHLQAAWGKYGESAFRFEVVTTCEPEQLLEQEQFWIDAFQTANGKYGYNVSPKAGSNLGVKRSDETKAKMSAAQIGKRHSDETKAKMSEAVRKVNMRPGMTEKRRAAQLAATARPEVKARMSAANRGRKYSAETIAKRSAAMMGHKCSDETRAKISAAAIGRKVDDETRAKVSTTTREAMTRPEVRERMLAGMRNRPGSKLNEDSVRQIRRMLADGMTHTEIAKAFGVSRSCIDSIKAGKRWASVT